MKIALAGNPNSGKTTMFNALTGQNERVGNWAGVTVDKKEHNIKKSFYEGDEAIKVVDLPGAYSMSPFTAEESVTREYVQNASPDVIINIVDATNLSRSLFFTTQLLELGIPMVVALNKTDINEQKNNEISATLLSEKLGCPVIETVSTSADGLSEVIKAAVSVRGTVQSAPYVQTREVTDKDSAVAADRDRFKFVGSIVLQVETRRTLTREIGIGDKIDEYITSKWLGIPIFAVVMFFVFQISQVWVGAPVADLLTGALGSFQEWIGSLLEGANPVLYSLLVDGVIGGVIAVIGFLPLVMVMYFLIAMLEDCGYMSRVAVVLDPIFKKVGLSGRSVIPFVITVGCAVPGIMASRTVRDERERRATAMLAPFMPCGAKIPVISLIAGMFFDNAGWVSTVMYLSGIFLIFVCALLVNKITAYKAKKSYFIIELPDYKLPSLVGAFKSMCSRGWSYVVKAATVILLCNTAVHLMQTFTWSFAVAESADVSILASVARPFAYILLPVVGVLSWQLAAAAITGFIAKENVVGTLAVCFVGLESYIGEELELIGSGSEAAALLGGITKAAALAYLMFNLYTPPCFAAIGAMSAEMKSAKWLWGGIGLQLAVGYTVSYLVYTLGTLITGEYLDVVTAISGLIVITAITAMIIGFIINTKRKMKAL
ncbi:MAG: ferrous iron transporter B [Clostridia bacterium]|nr:ferrous iron transporter B [Clostridia bacterium]